MERPGVLQQCLSRFNGASRTENQILFGKLLTLKTTPLFWFCIMTTTPLQASPQLHQELILLRVQSVESQGDLGCDPMPRIQTPAWDSLPVRAQQIEHRTGWRASAIDQFLISKTGGSMSKPVLVRMRPVYKHRVRNSKIGLWHPVLRPVPCPLC